MSPNNWSPEQPTLPRGTDPLAFLRTAKPLPPHIAFNVNAEAWARSVFTGTRYQEPRPGAMSSVALTGAMDDEDLYAQPSQPNVTKLSEWVQNVPGATTGDLVAHDVYVLPARGDDGCPTYVYVNVQHKESGAEVMFTTGSRTIQAFLLKALARGVWPVEFSIVRTSESVKGGSYFFAVRPPSA